MKHDFQVIGLERQAFTSFFAMSDEALSAHNAYLTVADAKPGYPCRVSLVDAEKNDRILVINHRHHNVDSPYQASGPIFVREVAENCQLKINEIPEVLKHRLLSLRGYHSNGNMAAATTCQSDQLRSVITNIFDDRHIEYLHVHNANPGCYACKIVRT